MTKSRMDNILGQCVFLYCITDLMSTTSFAFCYIRYCAFQGTRGPLAEVHKSQETATLQY